MRRTLWVALLSASLATTVSAGVIYVNGGATGANDGTSWADAFTDLQAALATASSGDEIWVVEGEYKPTATTDRTISFALKDGVGMYGGFNGTETAREQADASANFTTLSGDIGVAGDQSDNSYHVVTAGAGITAAAVLQGLRIFYGRASGAPADGHDRGGGMRIDGGSPTLIYMLVAVNYASAEGGGLWVSGGNPTIRIANIGENVVGAGGTGGGMWSGPGSSVTCTNCWIANNSVQGAASGAGAIESAGGTTLINSVLVTNTPDAIHLTGDGNSIRNTTISDSPGYGIVLTTSQGNTMSNSIVWWNDAGGILDDGLSSLSATYSDTQGGGLAGAGNISADPLFFIPWAPRPLAGSPVIDAGNNAAVPIGLTTDTAGRPRFFDDAETPDTGAGTPPIVDMGPYEYVPLPTVSSPPGLDLCEGDDAVFPVVAAGVGPFTYLWFRGFDALSNGGRISGVDTAALTIADVVAGDEGEYRVRVTDVFGVWTYSDIAVLTVGYPDATITAPFSAAVGSTDNTASVPASAYSTWIWTVEGGTLTSGPYDHEITFATGPPGTSMLLSVSVTDEMCTLSSSTVVQVDFLDVPPADDFHDYVIAVARAGITAGCGGGNFCGDDPVTRGQMAVFLLKSKYGSAYTPPACAGVFGDVPCPSLYANWIEQLHSEQITGGCSTSPLLYCPDAPVTRQQMAAFLLKAKHGSDYVPPACYGLFGDVDCPGLFADWIEQLFHEHITSGCGIVLIRYCPANPNTRGQMAVFLTKTFGLPLP